MVARKAEQKEMARQEQEELDQVGSPPAPPALRPTPRTPPDPLPSQVSNNFPTSSVEAAGLTFPTLTSMGRSPLRRAPRRRPR